MAKKGRPLSAAFILQQMMQPSVKPKRMRAKTTAKPAKPATSRPTAVVARSPRPAPGTFTDGRFSSPKGRWATSYLHREVRRDVACPLSSCFTAVGKPPQISRPGPA